MNIGNVSAAPASGLPATTGSPNALPATAGATSAAPDPTRDEQLAGLADVSASVNLLQQAGSLKADGSSDAGLLTFPPLAPMSAPKAAPAAATDDHGQSNVVFSDSDFDSALIR